MWDKGLWSGETKMDLLTKIQNAFVQNVWCKPAYSSKNTIPTAKYGDGSIKLIKSAGTGHLVKNEGQMVPIQGDEKMKPGRKRSQAQGNRVVEKQKVNVLIQSRICGTI